MTTRIVQAARTGSSDGSTFFRSLEVRSSRTAKRPEPVLFLGIGPIRSGRGKTARILVLERQAWKRYGAPTAAARVKVPPAGASNYCR